MLKTVSQESVKRQFAPGLLFICLILFWWDIFFKNVFLALWSAICRRYFAEKTDVFTADICKKWRPRSLMKRRDVPLKAIHAHAPVGSRSSFWLKDNRSCDWWVDGELRLCFNSSEVLPVRHFNLYSFSFSSLFWQEILCYSPDCSSFKKSLPLVTYTNILQIIQISRVTSLYGTQCMVHLQLLVLYLNIFSRSFGASDTHLVLWCRLEIPFVVWFGAI